MFYNTAMIAKPRIEIPDQLSLDKAVDLLISEDQKLASLIEVAGRPPLWDRKPGFPTLVHIILEQQVSLASARAAFDRLKDAAPDLNPTSFLQFSPQDLHEFGFSRQKTGYCQGLAHTILSGEFNLEALALLDDQGAREELIKIKGIGAWTADIYLLMALGRRDIWPSGDLALAVAAQRLHALPRRPGPEELERIAKKWTPWRSVAARILWKHYLFIKANPR
jgi:DNA-3-methyladenine glycosylase II